MYLQNHAKTPIERENPNKALKEFGNRRPKRIKNVKEIIAIERRKLVFKKRSKILKDQKNLKSILKEEEQEKLQCK